MKVKKFSSSEMEKKRITLTEEEKTRLGISDKASLSIPRPKNKKIEEDSDNFGGARRFLIVVSVFGSSGPLRFLVNGGDAVETVIDKTLRRYAHEGRLPTLGFDNSDFHLYPSDGVFKALNPSEKIGRCGVRICILCKKNKDNGNMTAEPRAQSMHTRKGNTLSVWLRKSLSFRVLSH